MLHFGPYHCVVWCWWSFSACPPATRPRSALTAGAINWFAPYLLQIATRAAQPDSALDLRIRVFVTCNPDAVPRIPGCTVTEMRPAVWRVLAGMLDPACADEYDDGALKDCGSSATSSASARCRCPCPLRTPRRGTTPGAGMRARGAHRRAVLRCLRRHIYLGAVLWRCAHGPHLFYVPPEYK
ncbi:hypothetical protein GGX14DRAFT_662084 [Mycena pura]|uniref:Uncharacterized protein n=1 Tax=Mycena pura TaxID=153505 RepID=A0AAD6V0L0_9AGAR|nr:hypothetical protein GGX14DRAFT_662084 [Mycena pura]